MHFFSLKDKDIVEKKIIYIYQKIEDLVTKSWACLLSKLNALRMTWKFLMQFYVSRQKNKSAKILTIKTHKFNSFTSLYSSYVLEPLGLLYTFLLGSVLYFSFGLFIILYCILGPLIIFLSLLTSSCDRTLVYLDKLWDISF